jgi:hypothetical protein
LYLVIIFLNKEEILDDLVSILIELGCTDATIVESQSMGRFIAHRIPIFAGLRLQLNGKNVYMKTMFAISDDIDVGKKVVHLLKDSGHDFNQGMGRIVTLKIESVLGEPQLPDLE